MSLTRIGMDPCPGVPHTAGDNFGGPWIGTEEEIGLENVCLQSFVSGFVVN